MAAFRRALVGRLIVWFLVVTTFVIGSVPADLSAAVLSPEMLISGDRATRDSALSEIRSVLEHRLITQRLADLGLSPEEIDARLSQLSDSQLRQLAAQLDSVMAGGDGLGVIVFLLVIAILAVILIQISGHKIIITK